MKIELEVKIDGERFFYDSAEESLTRGPDGLWNVHEPISPKTAYCYLHLMSDEAQRRLLALITAKSDESIPAKGDAQ